MPMLNLFLMVHYVCKIKELKQIFINFLVSKKVWASALASARKVLLMLLIRVRVRVRVFYLAHFSCWNHLCQDQTYCSQYINPTVLFYIHITMTITLHTPMQWFPHCRCQGFSLQASVPSFMIQLLTLQEEIRQHSSHLNMTSGMLPTTQQPKPSKIVLPNQAHIISWSQQP